MAIDRLAAALFLLTLVALFSAPAEALPKKKSQTHCICTCVAIDSKGKRHQGGTFSFTTPEGDCSIGSKVTCRVGSLQGAYHRCDGYGIDTADEIKAVPTEPGSTDPGGTGLPARGVAKPGTKLAPQ